MGQSCGEGLVQISTLPSISSTICAFPQLASSLLSCTNSIKGHILVGYVWCSLHEQYQWPCMLPLLSCTNSIEGHILVRYVWCSLHEQYQWPCMLPLLSCTSSIKGHILVGYVWCSLHEQYQWPCMLPLPVDHWWSPAISAKPSQKCSPTWLKPTHCWSIANFF